MDVPEAELQCSDGSRPKYTETLQKHLSAKTSSPQEEALLTAPVWEPGRINLPDFVVLPASRKRAVKTCQVS